MSNTYEKKTAINFWVVVKLLTMLIMIYWVDLPAYSRKTVLNIDTIFPSEDVQ